MKIICVPIVGIERITSISEYISYVKFLSEEKCERLNRFAHKEDLIRSLISDLLIRVMVSKYLQINNKDIRFLVGTYGKPFLEKYPLEFNVSHSGEWVVAVIDEYPVGIDVEEIQPIDLYVAKNFFSKTEYIDLIAKEQEEQKQYFFDLWTLKESYIKARGQGLSIPLDSFSFAFDGKNILFENLKVNENFHFRQYNVDNNYKLAVCSSNNKFPEKAIVWKLDQLLSEAIRLLS